MAHQKKGNERIAHFLNTFFFKLYIRVKHTKNKILDFFSQNFFERIAHSLISSERPQQIIQGRLFDLSDLSNLLTVAHFLWATGALRSRSLISSERPERIAQGRSFVLSDLSDLSEVLTVAHLIWGKWANERWAKEGWANERIPRPGFTSLSWL